MRLSVEFVISLWPKDGTKPKSCTVTRVLRTNTSLPASLMLAMRFLANENFAAVVALLAAGHDIVWVRPAEPGATDPDVFALAAPEERIPLTFAKDFGELTRASNRPLTCAVVLLRIPIQA